MDAGHEEQEGQHGELFNASLGLEGVKEKVYSPQDLDHSLHITTVACPPDYAAGPQGLTRLSTIQKKRTPPYVTVTTHPLFSFLNCRRHNRYRSMRLPP